MIYFTEMEYSQFPHFQELVERQLKRRGLKQHHAAHKMGFSQPMVSKYAKYPEELKKKGVDYALEFFQAVGFYEPEVKNLVRELFLEEFYKLYGDVDDLRKFAHKPQHGGN
jgi:predicted transcriptional regulator